MTIDSVGNLPLHPSLSNQATKGHVLSNLKSSSLIAMGPLCDDGCTIVLTNKKLTAIKNNKIILQGQRNQRDGLWDIPLKRHTVCMNNYQQPKSHPSLYIPVGQQPRPPEKKQPVEQPQQKREKQHDIQTTRYAVNNISSVVLDTIIAQQQLQDQNDIYKRVLIEPTDKKISVIIRKRQTHLDLVRYLHAACFSPVKSTWLKAIKNNNFVTWPALTESLVTNHLPISTATVQGHLHQQKQNLQSTKISEPTNKDNDLTIEHQDAFPSAPQPNTKCNHVAYILINRNDMTTAYQDLTGRFPVKSSSGNEYILIGYHYDANCILGHPVKDRKGPTLAKAWRHLHNEFKRAGTEPDIWILDNEISQDLKNAFNEEETAFQLVPPHSHRRNLAERAIQTWKGHFKAGLASTDPNFPLSEWDRLIPQANITLNLLRTARTNPALSAYAYIYGNFNFAATPLAPPGTKVIVHINPEVRGTWELNGDQGWYVGPALDHYRCVTCHFPRTRTTRICETVTFIPHDVPIPKVSLTDHLKQAAEDIVSILAQPQSSTTPSLQAGDPVRNALLDIATQLQRVEKIPELPKHTTAPTRVTSTQTQNPRQVPRVEKSNPPTSTILQEKSTTPLRFRHQPTATNRYNLRSRVQAPWNTQSSFRHRATQALTAAAAHLSTPTVNHIFRPDGRKETIDSVLQGSDRDIWRQSLSNEWGRLAQGNDKGVLSTDTIDFIHKNEVPSNQDITYATFVLDYRPLKSEPHRVRITVGGDRLTYNADAGAPAANMLETKILVNSTISDAKQGARFMSADLKDFFLATPMEGNEYMKVPFKHFPPDIKQRYDLDSKVTESGHIFIKIKKGMYGLKQAAILAYNNMKKHLSKYGYRPILGTTGMWEHKTRKTKFCVCVDDFGIKYYNTEDLNHLLNSLRDNYKCTVDMEGKHYCGLTFYWNYKDGYVDVAMPGYVREALHRLGHKTKRFPQYSPHAHIPIRFGKKGARQYATSPDNTPFLSPKDTKHIQSTAGSFLFYGRAIDNTILPALNEIASAQSQPTELTRAKAQQLMDYLNTYPEAYIRYHASDMVMHVDSDAAYLVAPKAKSRIAGYYHLSDHPNATKHPKRNGAILVECKTLRHVVSSSAEAEVAGIFHNATTAVPIRHILESLNHPQPPTPLKTDNSTATGFVYDNIHQKRSKAWDMRYHWLRDRSTQQQFNIFWHPGTDNDGDYYTKHHATTVHREQRAKYVRDKLIQFLKLHVLRGCVDTYL